MIFTLIAYINYRYSEKSAVVVGKVEDLQYTYFVKVHTVHIIKTWQRLLFTSKKSSEEPFSYNIQQGWSNRCWTWNKPLRTWALMDRSSYDISHLALFQIWTSALKNPHCSKKGWQQQFFFFESVSVSLGFKVILINFSVLWQEVGSSWIQWAASCAIQAGNFILEDGVRRPLKAY